LYGFETLILTLRENKFENVTERGGKENVLTEEEGEHEAVENCVRRGFTKRY
jgi:hypothetical protein